MPARTGVSLPLATSTLDAILRNPAFQVRLKLLGRRLNLTDLRQGWNLLPPRQMQVLTLLYSIPEVPLTYEQAGAELGVTTATAQKYEIGAVRVLRGYLANPDTWVGLRSAARALLLEQGVRGPQQLTRQVVQDLLGGDFFSWEPRDSVALNQRLAELGEPPLEKRLPRGYLESTPMAAWRLGVGFAPTPANVALATSNPDIASAFGVGANRPNQDMVRAAWSCLTFQQQAVMVALYAGGHGPGAISTMQAADLLGVDTRTVDRRHEAALARMAAFFAEVAQGASTS